MSLSLTKAQVQKLLDAYDKVSQELLRYVPPVAHQTARNKVFELRREYVKIFDDIIEENVVC